MRECVQGGEEENERVSEWMSKRARRRVCVGEEMERGRMANSHITTTHKTEATYAGMLTPSASAPLVSVTRASQVQSPCRSSSHSWRFPTPYAGGVLRRPGASTSRCTRSVRLPSRRASFTSVAAILVRSDFKIKSGPSSWRPRSIKWCSRPTRLLNASSPPDDVTSTSTISTVTCGRSESEKKIF